MSVSCKSTLVALCALALWTAHCDNTEPFETDADGDSDGDSDGDGDGDGDADGDADADGDSDGDADEETIEECTEEGNFCYHNQIHRCAPDGVGTEMVVDCATSPFTTCAESLCHPGTIEPHPCCVSDSPICDTTVEVSGEAPLEIDYVGTWDDGYSCTGYVVDGSDFTFRVDSQNESCQEGFVRVIIQGEIAELTLGSPQDICEGGERRLRRVLLSIAEDNGEGGWELGNYTGDDCSQASGTITVESWGTSQGDPFSLSAEMTLHDAASGATRQLQLSSSGAIVVY